ncbi:MAG: hypothetical protein QOE54_7310, partial [Streptosporangiaceae bacterium]|nr:hypothetical protein [Streptosporangiaceae bacterium]
MMCQQFLTWYQTHTYTGGRVKIDHEVPSGPGPKSCTHGREIVTG